MTNIEARPELEIGTTPITGPRELGQELLKRLPLRNNEFSPALVIEHLGRFAEWIREQTSLEEHARLFVLLENTIKEEVLHVQFHLAAKGDKFKRIILDLMFCEDETKFAAYEKHLYVVVPPRSRQEEVASPTILQEFSRFLKEAIEANSVPITS